MSLETHIKHTLLKNGFESIDTCSETEHTMIQFGDCAVMRSDNVFVIAGNARKDYTKPFIDIRLWVKDPFGDTSDGFGAYTMPTGNGFEGELGEGIRWAKEALELIESALISLPNIDREDLFVLC